MLRVDKGYWRHCVELVEESLHGPGGARRARQ